MKQLSLKVSAREESGRAASQRLRKQGKIPAVLYGPSGVRHLTIEGTDFRKLWKETRGSTALIELQTEGGEPALSIIQETDRDPRTDAFLHIDFKEILRGREMEAEISVHIVGEANGVRNQGGVLEVHLHEVGVRCRPRHLPEFVELDVSALNVGDSIKVKDLPALEGVTYTTDEDIVVAACAGAVVAEDDTEDEEDEEEAAAPAEA